MPIYEVYNPAIAQVNGEHLFSVAMFDVMKEGMKPEQAIDKAFKASRRDLRQISNRIELRGLHDYCIGYRVRRPGTRRQSLWRYWRGGLQGSEFTWAIAFYRALCRGVPCFRGLSRLLRAVDGSNPSLYAEVFSDPIYLNTVSTRWFSWRSG